MDSFSCVREEGALGMKQLSPRFHCCAVIIASLFGISCILYANQTLAQSGSAEISNPDPVISTEIKATESDEKIQARLESIFTEIDTLSAVTVNVQEGVVTLQGEVANETSAQQAQRLAGRLSGVVAVENEISRTLAVADNVIPVIESLRTNSRIFIKALPLIGLALLIVFAAVLLGNFLSRREAVWKKLAPNPFLSEILSQAARIVIFLLGVILALNLLGATSIITTILGGAGVVGLAIGFAVRDSIENYISSIMLSLRQPFRAKDHVVINDLEGVVVRLTSRATILMTLEGNHLRIPNSSVFKGVIVNYSTNPARRFEFKLGVGSADNPVAAMNAGLFAIQELEFILNDPEPFALIETVGDSNIVLSFYAWIDQRETNFSKARSLTIHRTMSSLIEEGFTLPEPIYHLKFDSQINSALKSGLDVHKDITMESEPDSTKGHSFGKHKAVSDKTIDVSPDNDFKQIVEEEIQSERDGDLLDERVRHE
ncbi:mechanosensitive ion channel domain-containing protein [Pseudomaricurvus sp.]|uniref:mechanosensitive ion channel domain-containing protein n=1 Tax=Pseudomaricurvus sp. TaxID=2004510 RepID=UPI003F6C234B